jgi:DNA/RNA-binding domain of Phe-tRNA-synthetase-like protein
MSTLSINSSEEFRQTYGDACVGFILLSCEQNEKQSDLQQTEKEKLVVQLRDRFPDKSSIKNDTVIQAYQKYYQQFKSNYHVRFQIETMTIKGKDMPVRSVLVDAMFMTELKYGLLIAGHDVNFVKQPITVDCAQPFEMFTQFGGGIKTLKAGDMCIRDAEKMLSCILYGPEDISPVTMNTNKVLYTIYGPAGVGKEMVSKGLDDIAGNIQIALPNVQVLDKVIVGGA